MCSVGRIERASTSDPIATCTKSPSRTILAACKIAQLRPGNKFRSVAPRVSLFADSSNPRSSSKQPPC